MFRNILITGASGFLGSHILKEVIANRKGVIALGNSAVPNIPFIKNDLTTIPKLDTNSISHVIHLAGKAHVIPTNEKEEEEFYLINHLGTENILEALENQKESLKSFVFTSTIAVYGLEQGENISEDHKLCAKTPYGISKLRAETSIKNWCTKNNIAYYIFRFPLIIGENPPGNLKIMLNAIRKGWYIQIKNNQARKSMVLAEDIARLIVTLEGSPSGIYNLSDGVHSTFEEVEKAMEDSLGKKIRFTLPFFVLKIGAQIGDLFTFFKLPSPLTSQKLKKMTSSLTINDQKARKVLNWSPKPVLDKLRTIK